jgi:hypothetical protein
MGYLRYKEAGVIIFTETGQEELSELLKEGMALHDIADFFCMDIKLLEELTGKDGQVEELHRHCTAHHKRVIRKNQLTLSGENAALAVHLGRQTLKQPKEPASEQPDEMKKVVGTLPDWSDDSGEWAHQMAPKNLSKESVIDQLKRMKQNSDAHEAALGNDKPDDRAQ